MGQVGHNMKRNLKPQPLSSTHHSQIAEAGRRRSGARTDARSGPVLSVSPVSERIIKETSVIRRKAMEVLASR